MLSRMLYIVLCSLFSLLSFSVSAEDLSPTDCLNKLREHESVENCNVPPKKKKKKKKPKAPVTPPTPVPAEIKTYGFSTDMCVTDDQYIEFSTNVPIGDGFIAFLSQEESDFLKSISTGGVISPTVKYNAIRAPSYKCPEGTGGANFFVANPKNLNSCENADEKPFCILVKSGGNATTAQCGSSARDGRYIYRCLKKREM